MKNQLRLMIALAALIATGCHAQGPVIDKQQMYEQLLQADWQGAFYDSGTTNWREKWMLDGQKATVTNSPAGMDYAAGPVKLQDMSHAVMWTKDSFAGDVKIEYTYTRLDKTMHCVNILYIQATGFGRPPFVEDITQWHEIRDVVPSMSMYYNYMNTYHISYAAWPVHNDDPNDDYIRLRRYMPDVGLALAGTDIAPDNYTNTGLFDTGVPHKITVIKKGNHVFMHIANDEQEYLCHWENTKLPPITHGRIGLRHMYTRAARYKDFKVSVLKE